MTTTLIAYRSDYLTRMIDPEDFGVDDDDVARLLVSGTATFKVFDPGVDLVLTAVASLGAATLFVSEPGLFAVGHRVELEQDDGTFHNTTVASVDLVAGSIGIDDVTTVAAAIGQRVRRTFTSAALPMTLFGTPAVGSKAWGYQGALADNGLHQTIGQEVVSQMTLDAGAGLKIIKLECLRVVESCDL